MTTTTPATASARSPSEVRSLLARLRDHADRHATLPPLERPTRETAPAVCASPRCSKPLDQTGRPRRTCSAVCRARLADARAVQARAYSSGDYHLPLTAAEETALRERILRRVERLQNNGRRFQCVWCGDSPDGAASYCSDACARAWQRWRKTGYVTIGVAVREAEETRLRDARCAAFAAALAVTS
jgi:hypothetical protein